MRLLDMVLSDGAVAFPIPNGGKRSRIEAAIMKGCGMVKAGIPDIELVHAGRAYFLEVKFGRGSTTAIQDAMHDRLRRAGCPVAVVRSLGDVRDCLAAWQIPHRISRPVALRKAA